MHISQHQGDDANGRPFGYVSGAGGGFFFTWHPSLAATLNSIEEDQLDGAGGLTASEVREYLREKLPGTTRGRQMWGADAD